MKSFLLIISFICLFSANSIAQTTNDRTLLKNVEFEKKEFNDRVVKYGFTEGKKTYNPLYHILSFSMYLYQKHISAQLSRDCAFIPSCSEYSKQLIKEYGIVKGTFLTSDRLTRCTRISLADKPSYYFDAPDGKIHETVERYRIVLKHNKDTVK